MSLKLLQFPGVDQRDIAASARRFADALDAGEYGETNSAVVVIDCPDQLWIEHWGETVSNYTAIGILETGKQHLLNSIVPPE